MQWSKKGKRKLQISTFFCFPVPPLIRLSLVEVNVNIIEGDKGVFCAVIEDPTVVVNRNISVSLHTMEGTAEGVASRFYYPILTIVRLCIILAHFIHDYVLAMVNAVD